MGRGQRVGIFGGSGVGKSTLIGMMTRNTAADLTVVGLVGERGREVREFLEDALGEEGRKRSVVLVSTSDQTPLLRMRAALAATSVAEFYASRGRHVLLVLDSLTRTPWLRARLDWRPVSHRRARAIHRLCSRGWRDWWTCWELQGWQYYGVLYGADGGRRSAGPAGGCSALLAGRACGAVAGDGGGGLVPGSEYSGFDQQADAGGDQRGASQRKRGW